MTGKLEVDSVWWRKVPEGEFYNVERNPAHGVSGGMGSLYFEIPASLVPEVLEFLGHPGIDVATMSPITVQVAAIGNPSEVAPLEFLKKSGGRMRIANQNRQQPSSKRHPAWVEAKGFPKAPDNTDRAEADKHYPDGGLRIFLVKTVGGAYYAGFTKGHRPANMDRDDPMGELYSNGSSGGLIRAATMRSMSENIKYILASWSNGRNALLYGPPGTGKTRLVSELFEALQAPPNNGRAILLDPNDVEAPLKRPELEIPIPLPAKVVWTTFHQSYGYEDFVLGLRLGTDGGTSHLRPWAGLFLDAALELADPGSEYQSVVVFIDEINRGNAARIFGEFMTFLDFDYRKEGTVPLPLPLRQLAYSGGKSEPVYRVGGGFTKIDQGFRFPRHVYIVATMNSVDRAAVPIDSALARRFDRIDMRPDPAVLARQWGLDVAAIPSPDSPNWGSLTPLQAAYRILDCLNVVIASDLGPEFELGHGLFTSIQAFETRADGTRVPVADDKLWRDIARVWDQVVFPQLEDRYSGRPEQLRKLLHVDSPPDDGGEYAWKPRSSLSTVVDAQALAPVRVSDLDVEVIKRSFTWLAR